jgi:NhaP-type Na+/H+ or K+/H+ antiporter
MAFGAFRQPSGEGEATLLTDELGELLNGVTLLVFGAALLWPTLDDLTWRIVLYAVLSLTIVRMAPVAVAMLGTGAHRQTVAFLGWFGPRGLASIVFAAIVVQEADLPHASTIVLTTYATVGLSVLAHGVTAAPLARRYAGWFASHPPEARPAMESVPAGTHRWRRAQRSPVT